MVKKSHCWGGSRYRTEALDEPLALCLLRDCLQDVNTETDPSAARAQISEDPVSRMMECSASRAGGKGPVGKPGVVSFLTHAAMTAASFLGGFPVIH